jgi:hypothetical protein
MALADVKMVSNASYNGLYRFLFLGLLVMIEMVVITKYRGRTKRGEIEDQDLLWKRKQA